MNIAHRIQGLRKSKGISQEELAEQIGVSRQAVSKWESDQSTPDISKIVLLSKYFGVTTDYLLKGTESIQEMSEKKAEAGIFTAVGTALNFIGIVVSIMIWCEEKSAVSVAVGFIIMAIGCMVFAVGQLVGKHRKAAACYFGLINVWLLSLIPISSIFNCIQGIKWGHWWKIAPVPQLRNSLEAYVSCWLIYFGFCLITDMILIIIKKRKVIGR